MSADIFFIDLWILTLLRFERSHPETHTHFRRTYFQPHLTWGRTAVGHLQIRVPATSSLFFSFLNKVFNCNPVTQTLPKVGYTICQVHTYI